MGMVKATAELGPSQDKLTEVEFLVDTGSFYTLVSPALAEELGITFGSVTTKVLTANNSLAEMPVTAAYMRLQDREAGILLGAMDVSTPLLGSTSMQALGLKVNPVNETIEIDRPFEGIPALLALLAPRVGARGAAPR